jgi:hypothetical protein
VWEEGSEDDHESFSFDGESGSDLLCYTARRIRIGHLAYSQGDAR